MNNNIGLFRLPETGFVRLADVLNFIPVSKSTWYEGVRKGVYPRPVKLSTQSAAYRAEDIHALIKKIGSDEWENPTNAN